MVAVRRWYIFLVCVITLQSVAWAVIALLRNLLIGSESVTAIAFQIAVIVIGLPLFLVHWLWAQRLARGDTEEREATIRRLYLYGTLAAFLGPFLANAFDLVAAYSPTEAIVRDLVALVVLALLWFYHRRIVAADARSAPEAGNTATVRRLYILGFSAVGVTMTTMGVIHLLRWIMFQFGSGAAIGGAGSNIAGLTDEVARLIVGVPLWLIFWRRAQGLFAGPGEEERGSALRKLYLYLTVFIDVLSAVTNATFILAGFFRRLLNLPPNGDIRIPLPIVVGTAVLWVYHAYVLRGDAALAGEAPRQAGIRRLYLYLVAAVGLAAFLVGLSGDISVLIRSFAGEFFDEGLREQLAWFTAALIAGLPVWLLPWRTAQTGAVASGSAGAEERRSVVRKIYLYFYLFLATMTVLSSMVYILYRLLSLVLGERDTGNLLSDLGQAIAFSVIAVGVWVYHGLALRGDGRRNQREQAQHLSDWRVAVVDVGEGRFGRAVLEGLRRELPGLTLEPIGPTFPAEAPGDQPALPARLSAATLIVGSWEVAVAGGSASAEIASAVVASPARKLLAPIRAEGWEWAGVDRWNAEAMARHAVRAVKQMVEGEEVKPVRPLGAGAIIGIIIGVVILLILLVIPVVYFFALRGY